MVHAAQVISGEPELYANNVLAVGFWTIVIICMVIAIVCGVWSYFAMRRK